jgi:hypothetical protein
MAWTIIMKTGSGFSVLFGWSRAFAADQSGNIIMLFALSAPIVLGFAALATEGGALFEKKAAVQAAADQAAVSAANSFNSSQTAYTIEGKAITAQMGFVDGQGGVSVTVNSPPASGPSTGKGGYVEVIISLPQPPMLSSLFHPSNYTIGGRAVAQYSGGPACVLALDPTASGALAAGGSTVVNMPKCNIVSDSSATTSLTVFGSASVTVNEAIASGGISATSGLVDNANIPDATPVPNPYAALSVPATSAWGVKQSVGSASPATLSPGWYNNGFSVNSSQHVTLKPGVYYIDGAGGGLSINASAVVTGTGVTFVLTSSSSKKNTVPSVSINGSATVNITAPTTNSALGTDSSGVVIFQDPKVGSKQSLNINGNSNTYFGGAVVAPAAAIGFEGTGVSGNGHNCTQIIGDTVTFIGNSSVSSDCSSQGSATINSAGKTVLSE